MPPTGSVPAQRESATDVLTGLAGRAVDALGWAGTVVGPITLVGRRVVVAAELDPEIHARRDADRQPPVLDRDEIAMWMWAELAHHVPAPAVTIRGVLAPGRHYRTATFGVSPFEWTWPVAMLLPRDMARLCVPARSQPRAGVVVAHDGAVDVLRDPRPPQPPRCLHAGQRWILERVYAAMLNQPIREVC